LFALSVRTEQRTQDGSRDACRTELGVRPGTPDASRRGVMRPLWTSQETGGPSGTSFEPCARSPGSPLRGESDPGVRSAPATRR
jgi:hypothetical protein